MTATRNQVFGALFALAQPLGFGGTPFVTMSRKDRNFATVDPAEQPAFFQTEPTEDSAQRTGMPSKRKWFVNWTILFVSDPQNPADVPTIRMNDFLDQVEALLPTDEPDQRQTLGDLAYHVFIEGTIIKIAGDQDGEGMLVIPVTVMMP